MLRASKAQATKPSDMKFSFTSLLICSLIWAFSLTSPLLAQTNQVPHLKEAHKGLAVQLDGVLSPTEPWGDAPLADGFRMSFPYDSLPATQRTQVWMFSDERFLYVAAVCWQDSTVGYVSQSLKRDFSFPVNDAFSVQLDPFSDRQSGFSFGLTPYGAQREGIIASGGVGGVTTSWDGKWYSATRRYGDRWILEIAIPFSTLRYRKDAQSWRVNFARNIVNRNETSTWAKVPRGFNIANMAFMNEVTFEQSPQNTGRKFVLNPYILGGLQQSFANGQNSSEWRRNAGLDAKVSLSSSLNLDLTINPDFSQVEVDRQQLNLDRFELSFPERRVFFLENSDLFSQLGKDGVQPFFSRRIGLGAPLTFGGRLSGKLSSKTRIGVMAVADGNFDARKRNLFTVAVAEQKVLTRSNVTAFMLNKTGWDALSATGQQNHVGGMEFNYNAPKGKLTGKAFGHISAGPNMGTDRHTLGLGATYNVTKWTLQGSFERIGRDFQSDMGFLPRHFLFNPANGQNVSVAYAQARISGERRFFFSKEKKLDYYGLGGEGLLYLDGNYATTEWRLRPYISLAWKNAGIAKLLWNQEYTKLLYALPIRGLSQALPVGSYAAQSVELSYDTGRRSKLNGLASISYGGFYNGQRLSSKAELYWRRQPWGNFGLNFANQTAWFPSEYGQTSLTLVGGQFEIAFRHNIFLTTFLQWNTQSSNFNINARFWWRFAPMSDLFLVLTDNYAANDFAAKDRALVLKVNYWL